MHLALHDIIYFVIVSVVLRSIVLGWIESAVRALLWRWLLRTERDVATYIHYKLRAQTKKAIHAAKSPGPCNDGDCAKIN